MTTGWGAQAPERPERPERPGRTAAADAGDRARADDLWKPLDEGGQAAILWSLGTRWRHLRHLPLLPRLRRISACRRLTF
jgi:hypothetical protein